jgi:hypothetical protein
VGAAKRRLKITEIPADEPSRVGSERKLQVLMWGSSLSVIREKFFWK